MYSNSPSAANLAIRRHQTPIARFHIANFIAHVIAAFATASRMRYRRSRPVISAAGSTRGMPAVHLIRPISSCRIGDGYLWIFRRGPSR